MVGFGITVTGDVFDAASGFVSLVANCFSGVVTDAMSGDPNLVSAAPAKIKTAEPTMTINAMMLLFIVNSKRYKMQ
jgi:hypothetical protein